MIDIVENLKAAELVGMEINATLVLIGDDGGRSAVTGEIYNSNTVRGFIVVETEHGSLYIDEELEVTVEVS